MQEKAAEEVHRIKGHDALLAAVRIIAPCRSSVSLARLKVGSALHRNG